MNKCYKWIFFDADDTLFDFGSAEDFALEQVFKSFDLVLSDEIRRDYKEISRSLFSQLEQKMISIADVRVKRFEILFSKFGIEKDARKVSEDYLVKLAQGSKLLPCVESVIKGLYKKYKMLIITNGISEVQTKRFESSTLRKYFEGIVISESIGYFKPDQRFFDHAIKIAGSPEKREVLIVGDSLSSDIAGGINSGIDTCWLNSKLESNPVTLKPTYEIYSIEQLLGLL